jgi:hypothetical protein
VQAVVDQDLARGVVGAAQHHMAKAQRLGVAWSRRHGNRHSGAARIELGLQDDLDLGLAPLPPSKPNEDREQHGEQQTSEHCHLSPTGPCRAA